VGRSERRLLGPTDDHFGEALALFSMTRNLRFNLKAARRQRPLAG
jgi:hypothetical protein